MRLTKMWTLSAPAVVAALALSVLPASAQRHGGGGGRARGGGSSGGQAVPRGGGSPGGVAVPRAGGPVAPYGGGVYRGGLYRGYGYGYLGRPYYAFTPRLGIGVGLWLGYPVTYPYWAYPSPYVYGYGYPYPYPADAYPVYGYPYGNYAPGYPDYPAPTSSAPPTDPNTVAVGSSTAAPAPLPTQPSYGGLSFGITPANAAVSVDGVYVGTVSQFAANTPPLTLAPGRHHIELRAEGYETMTFEVNVVPGQVLPYQGTMQRK